MQRTDSLKRTLMLGKIEGGRRRGWQRMRWLDGVTDTVDMSLCSLQSWWWTGKTGMLQSMGSQRVRHNWATELNYTKPTHIVIVQWLSHDPRYWSMPGFPGLHCLLECAQTHVHWVSDAIQLFHSPSPLLLLPLIFLASGPFPICLLLASGGQIIGDSASPSVPTMDTPGWFL